ncbi:MAG: SulP family inorganic anion transporter, partial [Clostridia bacterium]|nr:SulP family inorganic anion transporter [Clostridia bacterium]
MRPGLFPTLRNYKRRFLSKDISTGLIIAATSIPVSMGYAQIAGLPAVYGLYGSVFPLLLFAALSTSPQFIFGVDAAPAALIGGTLASMGIALGSDEAIRVIPAITLFVALWLLLFSLLKGGKIVNYISSPVMGGFITGIGVTIILMQLPKLMGSEAGTGELVELAKSLFAACLSINWLSLAIGLSSLVILLISQRLFPRFPMPVVLMALGVFSTLVFDIDEHGVALLTAVEKGMPKLIVPNFTVEEVTYLLGASLPIAVVILAETLLMENNYAVKNGYKLDDDREILAFSAGNFAAAFSGSLPVIGSVSRSAVSEQFGMKTQVGSLVASAALMAVLLLCTGFIGYLPLPVITAIVIASIVGVLEFDLAAKLSKSDKTEFFIFIAAFLGVLVLGTIYGVIIGILLSFLTVMIRAAYPPRTFLGII